MSSREAGPIVDRICWNSKVKARERNDRRLSYSMKAWHIKDSGALAWGEARKEWRTRRVCLFIPSSSDVIMTNKHLSKCVRSIQVNWKGHLSYTPTVLDQDSISEKLTPSSLSSSEDDHVGQEWKLFMNVKHKWSVWTQEDGEQPQVEAKPHDFLSAFTQIRAFKRDPGRCRIVQNQCFCLAI